MTPERWEQVTNIYQSALELDALEQEAYLDRACADDESLRREVESLLAADADAKNFIAEPVFKDVAHLLTVQKSKSLIGQSLNHYQIISRLGLGGMGEVYLGKDSKLNRHVAIKILPAAVARNENYLHRFQTEATAVATLNHPNIATIYSVEETGEQPFITLEYVKGKTLDALIPADGLSPKTFLEWFTPLADALSHAHENGIVHRDVKPGNIIINAEGMPKILDFGLARIEYPKADDFTPTLKLTQPGQIFGTPSYMSPEQAEGETVDHRSDIFSFGVVMYEAITGQRPFKGDSYASLVSNLLKTEPLPITELKPDVPFLLARLITKCLNKDRRQRFQSMREVRAVLEEIKAALEAGISMDSGSRFLVAKRQKRLSPSWMFLILSLIAIGLAVFALYYFVPQQAAPPINFANVTLRQLSQTNNVVYAHITPDGKSIVYNTIGDNEDRALYIRRVEDKNSLQLLTPHRAQFWGGMTVSPDGSQIYYITAEPDARTGTLYRISSLGGTPRKLVEGVNDLGSLSPDGKRVLFVRYHDKMRIVSANALDGSDERVILEAQTDHNFQNYRDPQFSPDGKRIFFIKFERINGDEFWSLIEMPLEGRQERVILPSRKPRISEVLALKDGKGLIVNATDSVSNISQLFHVSLTDGKETRITNDLNSYFGISISDDNETIVSAQRGFQKDVWTTTGADVNNLRKITTEPNVYNTAVWTPDGKIVFDAIDNNRPHIWIMNADGSSPQQLTPNDSFDYDPRVSPDGRFIVFTSQRSGETKLWRMNIDGSNQQILTPGGGATFNSAITPDGQSVIFLLNKEGKRVLGRVPITGGEVTEEPFIGEVIPRISPDAKQMASVIYDEQEKQYKTYLRPIHKDESSKVFNISPYQIFLWTPDGKNLLYRQRNAGTTVWMQSISGGEPKKFLELKPDLIFNLALSKDGKQTIVVRGKLLSDAVMLSKIRPN